MRFNFKLWIETDEGKPILGKGGLELLKAIQKTGSLTNASKETGMSYKFAWEYVKRIDSSINGVNMRKGGRNAGGSAITHEMEELMKIYEEVEKEIQDVLKKYDEKLKKIKGNQDSNKQQEI